MGSSGTTSNTKGNIRGGRESFSKPLHLSTQPTGHIAQWPLLSFATAEATGQSRIGGHPSAIYPKNEMRKLMAINQGAAEHPRASLTTACPLPARNHSLGQNCMSTARGPGPAGGATEACTGGPGGPSFTTHSVFVFN